MIVGKLLPLLACISTLVISCKPKQVSSVQNTAEQNCGEWLDPDLAQSPRGPRGLIRMNGKTPIFTRTSLDCNKPIALFIHGWAEGDDDPSIAPFDSTWAAQYQTFQFYWSELSSGDAITTYVDGSAKAADYLKRALVNLSSVMRGAGGNIPEIHLIGHSFGSKIAIEITHELTRFYNIPPSSIQAPPPSSAQTPPPPPANPSRLGGPISRGINDITINPSIIKITRLTLLDPALFLDSTQALRICQWNIGVTSNGQTVETAFSASASNLRIALTAIRGLQGDPEKEIKLEAYSTNVGTLFSPSLYRYTPVLDLTASGQGIIGFFEKIIGCKISQYNRSLFDVHVSVIDEYFASLSQGPLRTSSGNHPVISAAMPTEQLPRDGYYQVQNFKPGQPWSSQSFRKGTPQSPSRLYINLQTCNQSTSWQQCEEAISAGFRIQL